MLTESQLRIPSFLEVRIVPSLSSLISGKFVADQWTDRSNSGGFYYF